MRMAASNARGAVSRTASNPCTSSPSTRATLATAYGPRSPLRCWTLQLHIGSTCSCSAWQASREDVGFQCVYGSSAPVSSLWRSTTAVGSTVRIIARSRSRVGARAFSTRFSSASSSDVVAMLTRSPWLMERPWLELRVQLRPSSARRPMVPAYALPHSFEPPLALSRAARAASSLRGSS
ncbi:hypothetical protein APY04_0779 [Hyphomicrobium sulfonivorans]|uniref:Uncharacterized protein n=1 Tax=Hyphomicrobium sulfonivorans TaxID=121290 RepID=A0A109BKW5_HYPSL|nr:hypothetical protein APY04_0779 [Hyphomicrobium sulfonivorans]